MNANKKAVPDDLSAAIKATMDGEITDEHAGTMLHYLKIYSAEIERLKESLAKTEQERDEFLSTGVQIGTVGDGPLVKVLLYVKGPMSPAYVRDWISSFNKKDQTNA